MRDGAADSVAAVARLVRARNEIDGEISRIINRPVLTGRLGDWLASQLFDIDFEPSASDGFHGRFASGSLAARTVDTRWLGARDGNLDLRSPAGLDFCLVFTGPQALALTSRGVVRPLRIDACHLFDARRPDARPGVLASEWEAAEVFPRANNPLLEVEPEARALLGLFG